MAMPFDRIGEDRRRKKEPPVASQMLNRTPVLVREGPAVPQVQVVEEAHDIGGFDERNPGAMAVALRDATASRQTRQSIVLMD